MDPKSQLDQFTSSQVAASRARPPIPHQQQHVQPPSRPQQVHHHPPATLISHQLAHQLAHQLTGVQVQNNMPTPGIHHSMPALNGNLLPGSGESRQGLMVTQVLQSHGLMPQMMGMPPHFQVPFKWKELDQVRENSRNVQLEKKSVEDSLCRLQELKLLEEAQLRKLNTEIEQLRNEGTLFIKEKEALDSEVTALKQELVKAEELRVQLESFANTLEHSLGAANADNEAINNQLSSLTKFNEQLIEKQTAMDHRCAEIEATNYHLMEEISKLTLEFDNSKKREQSWREEVDRCRLQVHSLEEENRKLHEQFLSAQNLNQLTMVASQTRYSELQIELERVTKEMQELCVEREGLLIELQQLQESTNTAVTLLQDESKNLAKDMNELARGLEEASKERAALIITKEREIEEVKNDHQRIIESLRVQHGAQLAEQRKELETQIAKVKENMARRDNEKRQQIALLQVEKKSLQERVSAYTADLENERTEIARMRQEETERHLQLEKLEKTLTLEKEKGLNFQNDVTKLKASAKLFDSQLKAKNEEVESLRVEMGKLKTDLEEAKTTLSDREKAASEREKDLAIAEAEKNRLKETIEAELKQAEDRLARHNQEKAELLRSLEEVKAKVAEKDANINTLKETMIKMDKQLEDFKALVQRGDKKESEFEAEKARLESEIERIKLELRTAKQQINEEKSLKLFTESRLKDVEGRLKSGEADSVAQISSLKEAVNRSESEAIQLKNALADTEEDLAEFESVVDKLTRRVTTLEKENVRLQEESSALRTQLIFLRNFNAQ